MLTKLNFWHKLNCLLVRVTLQLYNQWDVLRVAFYNLAMFKQKVGFVFPGSTVREPTKYNYYHSILLFYDCKKRLYYLYCPFECYVLLLLYNAQQFAAKVHSK